MQKGAWLAIAVIIIAGALGTLVLTGTLKSPFYLLASQSNGASCTALQNVNCGSQVGGTITSISNLLVASNYAGLNGEAWLVNFVLNGNGQYLFGSTAKQIAQATNSSLTARFRSSGSAGRKSCRALRRWRTMRMGILPAGALP